MIKSRRMKWAGQVARMGEMRNAGKNFMLAKWVLEVVHWINLAEGGDHWQALVIVVMNLPVP
jgi:hypothetical protein